MATVGWLLHRFVGLFAAIALTLILLYLSRFWIWVAPWGPEGLLGIKQISPWGDNVRWWLRGTGLDEFAIVIWGCGAIIVLSVIQWITSKVVK